MPDPSPASRPLLAEGPVAPASPSLGPFEVDSGVELSDGSTVCPASFGPYRVVGVIGRGGMGVVYAARHESTGQAVAIKTARLRKRGFLRRIRREILALMRIGHPGLARIIQTGQADGLPWYAMELVRGTTLHDRLDGLGTWTPRSAETHPDFVLAEGWGTLGPSMIAGETNWMAGATRSAPTLDEAVGPPSIGPGTAATLTDQPAGMDEATRAGPSTPVERLPLPPEQRAEFLALMAKLCHAMAYLHGEGVVHRDVKPQNVIIRPDGSPVLLDFGLASYSGVGGRECLEVGGQIEGTPEYMAPEQVRGEAVDARADLYAVGCLLYEGLAGRVPFRGVTPGATLRAQIKEDPLPPRQFAPDLPEELETLVLRLLAKRPRDRPGYARDVEEALARFATEAGDWARDCSARDYLYRPEFVGRSEVLSRLEGEIHQSLKWPGRCLFLRGASGVGKTRLVVELARRLEAGGLSVVTGECLPIGVEVEGEGGPNSRATPLHPFRTLLQCVADSCLEHGPGELRRLLGRRARILAECEPVLSSLPGLPEDDPEPESDGDGRRSRLIEALGETLTEFGRDSPVVVFLDDLQWADALTLHFLALFHIGAWDSPRVAILAAYRSEEEDDALRGYRPVFQDATFVDLEPLGEDDIGEIIGGMLGSREADDCLVAHLARRSGGNPFFAAESLRAAVAEGLLRRDGTGTWRPTDADGRPAAPESLDVAIPPPGSIHELIVRRLARLPEDARALLELIAVLGREVDSELLDSVAPIGEAEAMNAVEALLVAHILEEDRDGHLRFAHDKIREVAYEQIPPDRRRDLHRQVARAIELRHEGRDDFPQLVSILAHHWYRAIGDRSADPVATSRAIDYLERSVIHAVNTGQAGEAVHLGRSAARLMGVELPEDPVEIARDLAVEMGLIREALDGRSPLDLLAMPDADRPAVDRVIGLLLTIHPPAFLSDQIHLFALMAAKDLGLTLTHGPGPLAPAVYGMYAIVIRILLDDARLAHEFGRLAIELDRRRGGSLAADVLFFNACFLHHWVAPIAEGLDDCAVAAEAGLKSGAILYGCFSHGTHVIMLAASGAPLAEVIQDAEARLGRVGHRVLIARYHCVLERQVARALAGQTASPTCLTDDDFDEDRDLAFICRTTNANQAAYYHAARLKLHYHRGDYRDALDASDRARAVAGSCARQIAEIDLVYYRALTLLALADEGSPRRSAHLQEAVESLATIERWRLDCEANFGHKAMLLAAEVARAEGRPDDALSLYDQAARSADAQGSRPHAALARELEARHRARLGDHAGAEAARLEAIARYRDWGASTIADRLSED